jgi:hypothetical protein
MMELADCNERVGTWTFKILLNHGIEVLECTGLNVELPFKVGAHLTFHPVDLGGNHECRDEHAVSGGTASGDESRLQSPQKVGCGKCHGGREPRAVECVGDEVCEGRGGNR